MHRHINTNTHALSHYITCTFQTNDFILSSSSMTNAKYKIHDSFQLCRCVRLCLCEYIIYVCSYASLVLTNQRKTIYHWYCCFSSIISLLLLGSLFFLLLSALSFLSVYLCHVILSVTHLKFNPTSFLFHLYIDFSVSKS